MRRIKLTVAYDGTDYCGWQIQPNGITVEEVLNKALSDLTKETVKVIGASRTDAGVHARGNVAVFDTKSPIPPERIAYAVNALLPDDIVVVRSEEVGCDWHPRYQNSIKTYEYTIVNREMPDPLRRRDSWFVSFPLDIDDMKKAARYFIGEHDFKTFCSVHTGVKTTVRRIDSLDVEKKGERIKIRISGNGFLYNMVRIIAGTLVEVGRGAFAPSEVKEMLEQKERGRAGATAPPQGLVLLGIVYDGQADTERGQIQKDKDSSRMREDADGR